MDVKLEGVYVVQCMRHRFRAVRLRCNEGEDSSQIGERRID